MPLKSSTCGWLLGCENDRAERLDRRTKRQREEANLRRRFEEERLAIDDAEQIAVTLRNRKQAECVATERWSWI